MKKLKIFIAGHRGMVGSACCRFFSKLDSFKIITSDFSSLDLRDQKKTLDFISFHKPDIIINSAAKVGGILANSTYPYEFLYDNLQIQNNLIHSAHANKVKKFIFLGSSCIYPKFSPQPIKEEYLLDGKLEPTNEWYAIAKISGVKLIQALNKQHGYNYTSLMPTNLYGYNDNFDLNSSHVLPALIRKFHDAMVSKQKTVTLWGTGKPLREFMFVDDLAEAIFFVINNETKHQLINVGSGFEISIHELALLIKNTVGFVGKIIWDDGKPDGTPRKLLDTSILNLMGFKAKTNLESGIKMTYNWYKNKLNEG